MAGGGSLRAVPGPERYRLAGHGDRGTSLRRRRGSEGIGARRGGFWRLFHRRDGFGIPPADVETGVGLSAAETSRGPRGLPRISFRGGNVSTAFGGRSPHERAVR